MVLGLDAKALAALDVVAYDAGLRTLPLHIDTIGPTRRYCIVHDLYNRLQ